MCYFLKKIQDNKQAKNTVTTRDFADRVQNNDLTLDDVYGAFPSDSDDDLVHYEIATE